MLTKPASQGPTMLKTSFKCLEGMSPGQNGVLKCWTNSEIWGISFQKFQKIQKYSKTAGDRPTYTIIGLGLCKGENLSALTSTIKYLKNLWQSETEGVRQDKSYGFKSEFRELKIFDSC